MPFVLVARSCRLLSSRFLSSRLLCVSSRESCPQQVRGGVNHDRPLPAFGCARWQSRRGRGRGRGRARGRCRAVAERARGCRSCYVCPGKCPGTARSPSSNFAQIILTSRHSSAITSGLRSPRRPPRHFVILAPPKLPRHPAPPSACLRPIARCSIHSTISTCGQRASERLPRLSVLALHSQSNSNSNLAPKHSN